MCTNISKSNSLYCVNYLVKISVAPIQTVRLDVELFYHCQLNSFKAKKPNSCHLLADLYNYKFSVFQESLQFDISA